MSKLSKTSQLKGKLLEAYQSWAKADEDDMQENNRFIERIYEVLKDTLTEIESIEKVMVQNEQP